MVDILFKQIKEAKGSNAKLAIAKKEFTIKHHNFFEVCFNDVRYGISGAGIKKAIDWQPFWGKGEDIAAFVDTMLNNFYTVEIEKELDMRFPISSNNTHIKQIAELITPLSGNSQIEKLKELLGMLPREDIVWAIRAIQKDMRIGISLSSYNKIRVQHGMKPIVKRGVQLCGKREVTPDMVNFADLSYPRIAEYKYDGERCEITLTKKTITRDFGDGPVEEECVGCKLVSRGNKDITERYPEVVDFLKDRFSKTYKPEDSILELVQVTYDAEIISKDFITLSRRMQRKADNIEGKDTDLKAIIFDITAATWKDDKHDKTHICDYTKKCQQKNRRDMLELNAEHFGLDLSYTKVVDTKEELYDFYLEARKIDQEGVVTKDFDMVWTPHSRDGWFKLVPREHLDLKVVEGHYGNGIFSKQINCLTVTNKDGSIKTNVASGITNQERTDLTNLYNDGKLKDLVVEIAYREKCPPKEGVSALRFPVFIRIRDDKALEEID